MIMVYIVACVSEDSYVNVDSVWTEYYSADKRCEELFVEDEREWEVISHRVTEE